MNAQRAALSTRERLYQNLSLLEAVAEYARRNAGEGTVPQDIPKLTERGQLFLRQWQGHAAARLWLRLAQPTLDALQTYVDLDLAPSETTEDRDDDGTPDVDMELREALDASQIALETLVQRLDFLADRSAPDAAAS